MSNMRVTHMLYTDVAAPPTPAFIFTAVTTGVGQTFTLPLEASGTYNCNVDWGDTNSDTITVWNQAETTHTYGSAGTYVVTITGTITGWRFKFSASSTKIYEVREWGPLRLGNSTQYFSGCSNLTVIATDVLDMTGTTTLERAFELCSSLTTVPSMDSWDVSSVTSMYETFNAATLFNQDISSWDVSNVTDMSYTFASTSFDQDISSWVVTNVIYMRGLFSSDSVFNQDIGSWNVSSVITMDAMFADDTAFNQDISSWDVSNVTDMDSMFARATSFNQNIGGWTTSSLTEIDDIFRGATLFNQDIGSWNVSNVISMYGAFRETTSFNQDISSWDVSNVTRMDSVFRGATSFNQNIGGWTTSSLIRTDYMFDGTTSFDQDIGSWDITLITNATNMFNGIALSTANYNALLTGWEAQVEKPNVTFDGGNSTYNAGAPTTARAALQASGWVITDGGQV